MKKEKVICLFLFVVLVLVFSSCHPRHVLDIKPAMTKEEVVSAWGGTGLITYKTTNGITLETWEYHFASSHSICQITFNQDRVTDTPQCDRPPVKERYYVQTESQPYPEPYYYPYPYSYLYPYPYPYLYYSSPYPYYRYHSYHPDHHYQGYPYHPHRR